MKKIPLTQEKFALIDDEDFDLISQYKWCAVKNKNIYYTMRGYWDKQIKKRKQIKMHRLIMGVTDPKIQIDHINGDGLDNRKVNLRICTNQQNHMNRKSNKNCSSKFKGVSWFKRDKKWRSQITVHQKKIYLGDFNNETQAAIAYNTAAIKHFGQYAYLNIIKEQ